MTSVVIDTTPLVRTIIIGILLAGCSPYRPRLGAPPLTCLVPQEELDDTVRQFSLDSRPHPPSPYLSRIISRIEHEGEHPSPPLVRGEWCYFIDTTAPGVLSLSRTAARASGCASDRQTVYSPPIPPPGTTRGLIQGVRIDSASSRVALLLGTDSEPTFELHVLNPALRDAAPLIIARGAIRGFEFEKGGDSLVYTTGAGGRAERLHGIALSDRKGNLSVDSHRELFRISSDDEALVLRRDPVTSSVVLTIDSPRDAREATVFNRQIHHLPHARGERRNSVWFRDSVATLVWSYRTGGTSIEITGKEGSRTIHPSSGGVIHELYGTADALYFIEQAEGEDLLRMFHRNGTINDVARAMSPAHRFRFGSAGMEPALSPPVIEESVVTPPVRYPERSRDLQVITHEIPSEDGTRIPLTIIRSLPDTAQRAAKQPTVLTAYGAYGVRAATRYSTFMRLALSLGFDVAIAHVRGGGERGPSWHRDAQGPAKQRSVNDFLAVARALHEGRHGMRGPLVWYGKSAGGTLVTAAALQAPHLPTKVVVDAGFLDVNRSLTPYHDLIWHRDRAEWGYPAPVDPCRMATPSTIPPFLLLAGMQDTVVPYTHAAGFYYRIRRECPECDASIVISHHGTHEGERYLEDDTRMLSVWGGALMSTLR